MGKLKNVEKYIDVIIILYCCSIVAISLAVVLVSNRDNDLKAENLKIKRELEAKNKDLKEISNRLEAYKKYVRDTEEANRNTVMDKYTNGYDYTVVVGNDYYSVTPDLYNRLSIGEIVDTNGWEKNE